MMVDKKSNKERKRFVVQFLDLQRPVTTDSRKKSVYIKVPTELQAFFRKHGAQEPLIGLLHHIVKHFDFDGLHNPDELETPDKKVILRGHIFYKLIELFTNADGVDSLKPGDRNNIIGFDGFGVYSSIPELLVHFGAQEYFNVFDAWLVASLLQIDLTLNFNADNPDRQFSIRFNSTGEDEDGILPKLSFSCVPGQSTTPLDPCVRIHWDFGFDTTQFGTWKQLMNSLPNIQVTRGQIQDDLRARLTEVFKLQEIPPWIQGGTDQNKPVISHMPKFHVFKQILNYLHQEGALNFVKYPDGRAVLCYVDELDGLLRIPRDGHMLRSIQLPPPTVEQQREAQAQPRSAGTTHSNNTRPNTCDKNSPLQMINTQTVRIQPISVQQTAMDGLKRLDAYEAAKAVDKPKYEQTRYIPIHELLSAKKVSLNPNARRKKQHVQCQRVANFMEQLTLVPDDLTKLEALLQISGCADIIDDTRFGTGLKELNEEENFYDKYPHETPKIIFPVRQTRYRFDLNQEGQEPGQVENFILAEPFDGDIEKNIFNLIEHFKANCDGTQEVRTEIERKLQQFLTGSARHITKNASFSLENQVATGGFVKRVLKNPKAPSLLEGFPMNPLMPVPPQEQKLCKSPRCRPSKNRTEDNDQQLASRNILASAVRYTQSQTKVRGKMLLSAHEYLVYQPQFALEKKSTVQLIKLLQTKPIRVSLEANNYQHLSFDQKIQRLHVAELANCAVLFFQNKTAGGFFDENSREPILFVSQPLNSGNKKRGGSTDRTQEALTKYARQIQKSYQKYGKFQTSSIPQVKNIRTLSLSPREFDQFWRALVPFLAFGSLVDTRQRSQKAATNHRYHQIFVRDDKDPYTKIDYKYGMVFDVPYHEKSHWSQLHTRHITQLKDSPSLKFGDIKHSERVAALLQSFNKDGLQPIKLYFYAPHEWWRMVSVFCHQKLTNPDLTACGSETPLSFKNALNCITGMNYLTCSADFKFLSELIHRQSILVSGVNALTEGYYVDRECLLSILTNNAVQPSMLINVPLLKLIDKQQLVGYIVLELLVTFPEYKPVTLEPMGQTLLYQLRRRELTIKEHDILEMRFMFMLLHNQLVITEGVRPAENLYLTCKFIFNDEKRLVLRPCCGTIKVSEFLAHANKHSYDLAIMISALSTCNMFGRDPRLVASLLRDIPTQGWYLDTQTRHFISGKSPDQVIQTLMMPKPGCLSPVEIDNTQHVSSSNQKAREKAERELHHMQRYGSGRRFEDRTSSVRESRQLSNNLSGSMCMVRPAVKTGIPLRGANVKPSEETIQHLCETTQNLVTRLLQMRQTLKRFQCSHGKNHWTYMVMLWIDQLLVFFNSPVKGSEKMDPLRLKQLNEWEPSFSVRGFKIYQNSEQQSSEHDGHLQQLVQSLLDFAKEFTAVTKNVTVASIISAQIDVLLNRGQLMALESEENAKKAKQLKKRVHGIDKQRLKELNTSFSMDGWTRKLISLFDSDIEESKKLSIYETLFFFHSFNLSTFYNLDCVAGFGFAEALFRKSILASEIEYDDFMKGMETSDSRLIGSFKAARGLRKADLFPNNRLSSGLWDVITSMQHIQVTYLRHAFINLGLLTQTDALQRWGTLIDDADAMLKNISEGLKTQLCDDTDEIMDSDNHWTDEDDPVDEEECQLVFDEDSQSTEGGRPKSKKGGKKGKPKKRAGQKSGGKLKRQRRR